jgi:hypothetical protein
MPSRRKKQSALPFSAAEVATIARSNPYIQRLIVDAKLRNNLRTAAESARTVYERVSNGKLSARSLLQDKKSQSELRKAAENLRDATLALTEAPKKRRKVRVGRVLLLTGIGTGVALAASEKLRSKVLDLVFGAEEEFQYTPPPSTAPPTTPPPAGTDTATGSPADTAAATGTQAGSAPGSA